MTHSPGQRALDATLADCRHELASARTRRRRLVVRLRTAVAISRTVWRAGLAEMPAALKSSLLLRVAVCAVAWFAIVAWRSGLPGDDRFFLVAPAATAWALVAASFVSQLPMVFPVLVFLAEATGRRSRVTPVFGSFVLVIGCAVGLVLVVFPIATEFVSFQKWSYFANASQPAPDIVAGIPKKMFAGAALFASIATGMMFVLAGRVRRVGGVTGWVVGVGPALGVWLGLVGFVLLSVPSNVPTAVRIGVMLMQPLALFAAVLWSTRRLGRLPDLQTRPTKAFALK